MRRTVRTMFIALLLFASGGCGYNGTNASYSPAAAEMVASASIVTVSGTLVDASNAPLANYSVLMNGTNVAVTDSSGNYSFTTGISGPITFISPGNITYSGPSVPAAAGGTFSVGRGPADTVATGSTGKIKSDTNIVVYGDSSGSIGTDGWGGVTDQTVGWVTHFLDWWKTYDNSISYVVLNRSDLQSPQYTLTNYPNVKIYIQPGGDAYHQQLALGSAAKTNINNFIDSGKAYVGICAGFYYAASDYWWWEKQRDGSSRWSYYKWPNMLGKYPATVEGSIYAIWDYNIYPYYKVTTVSNGNQMLYFGGPTRGYSRTSADYPGQALLTYSGIPGALPAAIKYNNLLLVSAHPEAYDDGNVQSQGKLTNAQVTANYIWFAKAINSVAGTSFSVP